MLQTPLDILAKIEQAKRFRAKVLDLSNAGLTEIPEEIFDVDNLERLNIRTNQIRTIPADIRRLVKLKWLDVRGNPLEQVTDVYGLVLDRDQYERFKVKLAAENIIGLQLCLMKDEKLPEFFFQLSNLAYLDLSSNLLMIRLTKLAAKFNLHANQLRALGEVITKLTHLTMGNQLTLLPDAITQLTNLTTLNLNGNQLKSLPKAITKLTNLTSIDLRGNQLPEAIGNLTKLTMLDLYGNQLTALPEAIADLERLRELNLVNNPLKYPPKEIVAQGLDAIRNYTGYGLFCNVIASVSQRSNPFKIKRLLRQKTPRNDCNFNLK
jgi:Leucine-rich repeat (LRR) protein